MVAASSCAVRRRPPWRARPFAEHMDKVLRSIASPSPMSIRRRNFWAAPAATSPISWSCARGTRPVRARSTRPSCGSRASAPVADQPGQQVKFLCVGRKATISSSACSRNRSSTSSSCGCGAALRARPEDRRQDRRAVRRALRRLHPSSRRFKSVIAQIPTATAHPAELPGSRG